MHPPPAPPKTDAAFRRPRQVVWRCRPAFQRSLAWALFGVLRAAALAASDVIIAHPNRRGQTQPRAPPRLGIVSLAPAQFPKAKSFQRTANITGSAIADMPGFAPVRELQPRRAAVSRRARAWGRSCLNARARCIPCIAVAHLWQLRLP